MPRVVKGKGGRRRNPEALPTSISPGTYRDVVPDTSSDDDDPAASRDLDHADENTLSDTSLVLDVEGDNSPVKVTKTRKTTTFTETTRADKSPVIKRRSPRVAVEDPGCARANRLYPDLSPLSQRTAEESELNSSYGSSPNERGYRKATYTSSPEDSRYAKPRDASSPEQSITLARRPLKKGTTDKNPKQTAEFGQDTQPESPYSTNNSLYIICFVFIVLLVVALAVISQSSKHAVVPEKPQEESSQL